MANFMFFEFYHNKKIFNSLKNIGAQIQGTENKILWYSTLPMTTVVIVLM